LVCHPLLRRFVRTAVFEEEMQAQRVLYRGFGSQKPGGVLTNAFDIRCADRGSSQLP
jgi:all-trans-8'-apo-beta-carotenal 15,15'-oxygenase